MKQEKTANEWFDLLIEPYCSQAKANAIYHGVYEGLCTAICAEFSWELTPPETQGDRYWRTVYTSIFNKETTYLKPTEPAQPQFGEWVKVEDRLPELDEVVLVIDNEGRRLISWRYKYDIMDEAEWSIEYPYNSDAFTHWTCLPPNPKD